MSGSKCGLIPLASSSKGWLQGGSGKVQGGQVLSQTICSLWSLSLGSLCFGKYLVEVKEVGLQGSCPSSLCIPFLWSAHCIPPPPSCLSWECENCPTPPSGEDNGVVFHMFWGMPLQVGRPKLRKKEFMIVKAIQGPRTEQCSENGLEPF